MTATSSYLRSNSWPEICDSTTRTAFSALLICSSMPPGGPFVQRLILLAGPAPQGLAVTVVPSLSGLLPPLPHASAVRLPSALALASPLR